MINSIKSHMSAKVATRLAGATAVLYMSYSALQNHHSVTQATKKVFDVLQNAWLWNKSSNPGLSMAASGFADAKESGISNLTGAIGLGAAFFLAGIVAKRIKNLASERLPPPALAIPVEHLRWLQTRHIPISCCRRAPIQPGRWRSGNCFPSNSRHQ